MHRVLSALAGAALLATQSPAQEPEPQLVFRDFTSVQRLRVVCEHEHYGRVVDLIAEVPTGRIRDAVVSMWHEGRSKTVVVPFASLRYEARSNLLELGPCLEGDHSHPAFDARKVRVEGSKREGHVEVSGAVLVSKLTHMPVALASKGAGSVQGATVELSQGRVAFLHVSASSKPTGDGGLHPAPWSAARLGAGPAGEAAKPALTLALDATAAALAKAPSMLEVILQDALHRPRVYRAFGVPAPSYDRR